MLTVPQAARHVCRNPETVRRWIGDPAAVGHPDSLPLPPEWKTTFWGGPMADWVAIMRQDRDDH